MQEINKAVIIGAGNVATHLGPALKESGMQIMQVFSRTRASAEILARKIGCEYTTDIKKIQEGADIYVFCLSDSALFPILEQFPHKGTLSVHTSGSLSIDIFKAAAFTKAGVFYPLQTFSKNTRPDFQKIPICLEANNEELLTKLEKIALAISPDVRQINSAQREILHLAAVFACNFTNHMLAISNEILEMNQLPTDILHPLIEETIRKAIQQNPAAIQTGPAMRKDYLIMGKHIKQLSALPEYRKIYTFISESIIAKSEK